MQFTFSIKKTIAAVTYLAELKGGELDMLRVIKTLYLADRAVFLETFRTITGDWYVSMDNGPVLSCLYDLIRDRGRGQEQSEWTRHFSHLSGTNFSLTEKGDIDVLSDLEKDAIREAFASVNSYENPGELIAWLHRKLPEWKRPHGSRIPIEPEEILRNEGFPPEIIQKIANDLQMKNSVLKTFSST